VDHRRVHVSDTRRFLHVRSRCVTTQEHDAHTDEEHDGDSVGHGHVLLLRVVDLLWLDQRTLHHRIQAMFIGAAGVVFAYVLHHWVEKKFKIDDAVGAVAVHGYAGFFGVCIAGFVLWGYPSSMNADYASINPVGQFIGAVIMFWVLGFMPAWIVAGILKKLNLLRIPPQVELAGLDLSITDAISTRPTSTRPRSKRPSAVVCLISRKGED